VHEKTASHCVSSADNVMSLNASRSMFSKLASGSTLPLIIVIVLGEASAWECLHQITHRFVVH
jgi:hypothetical protein